MKRMLIVWEMRDSSMSFTPILPQTSQHTIHKVLRNELGRYFHLKEESIGPLTVYLGGRVR